MSSPLKPIRLKRNTGKIKIIEKANINCIESNIKLKIKNIKMHQRQQKTAVL